MKIRHNDIVLRPRFELVLGISKEKALNTFNTPNCTPFELRSSNDHVFIKFNRVNHHFWSPQLHLEFIEEGHSSCKLLGLFGPNPALWTFFIFLHFGVATLFIILAIQVYTSAVLELPNTAQLVAMFFLITLWLGLYAFGRAGKQKGKPQMIQLHQFMMERAGIYVISADSQTA